MKPIFLDNLNSKLENILSPLSEVIYLVISTFTTTTNGFHLILKTQLVNWNTNFPKYWWYPLLISLISWRWIQHFKTLTFNPPLYSVKLLFFSTGYSNWLLSFYKLFNLHIFHRKDPCLKQGNVNYCVFQLQYPLLAGNERLFSLCQNRGTLSILQLLSLYHFDLCYF